MLIFVGSLLWWQQDAAGGNKNGGSKKNRQKSGYFSFWKFHEYIKGEEQASKFKFDFLKN